MSKWFSHSNSFLSAAHGLGRRSFALRLGFGAAFMAASQLCCEPARAADGNEVLQGAVYARLKSASLVVLLEGQMKGSGALVDASGLVITSAHGIGQKGSRVEVLTATAERLRAEVVAVDLGHDLALLRLPAREGGYPFLLLADRPSQPGETLFCLGQPESLGVPVLFRTIMANEASTFVQVLTDYVQALALEGTLPPGTSGGPWVDNQGRLVAVQFGFLQMHNIPIGVAFASPLNAVRQLLTTRKHAATPYTGMMISELWRQQPNFLRMFPLNSEGLFINAVTANQPAARSGLKQGDLIVEVEGRSIRFRDEFLTKVRTKKPGEQLSIAILEPGAPTKREVTITLGLLEASWR
jgi:serine protease Do